jgi:hypothetical protein
VQGPGFDSQHHKKRRKTIVEHMEKMEIFETVGVIGVIENTMVVSPKEM